MNLKPFPLVLLLLAEAAEFVAVKPQKELVAFAYTTKKMK